MALDGDATLAVLAAGDADSALGAAVYVEVALAVDTLDLLLDGAAGGSWGAALLSGWGTALLSSWSAAGSSWSSGWSSGWSTALLSSWGSGRSATFLSGRSAAGSSWSSGWSTAGSGSGWGTTGSGSWGTGSRSFLATVRRHDNSSSSSNQWLIGILSSSVKQHPN